MKTGPRFPKMAIIVSGKYLVREKPIVLVMAPCDDLKMSALTWGPLTPSHTAFLSFIFYQISIVMIAITDRAKII